MFGKKEINKSRAWKRLEHHYKSMRKVEMRDMFRKDPQRAERYSINLEGLTLDYSKNRINDRTMKYLLALAKERKLDEKIEEMFRGERINITEHRPVLHVALRNRSNTPIYVDGKDVMPEINASAAQTRKSMRYWLKCASFRKPCGWESLRGRPVRS